MDVYRRVGVSQVLSSLIHTRAMASETLLHGVLIFHALDLHSKYISLLRLASSCLCPFVWIMLPLSFAVLCLVEVRDGSAPGGRENFQVRQFGAIAARLRQRMK